MATGFPLRCPTCSVVVECLVTPWATPQTEAAVPGIRDEWVQPCGHKVRSHLEDGYLQLEAAPDLMVPGRWNTVVT